MKAHARPRLYLLAALGLVGPVTALATLPVVQSVSADSVALPGGTTLRASVGDSDGDLAVTEFYVNGPGISGWLHVGSINVSGAQASPQIAWQPNLPGIYTVRADVFDTSGSASSQRSFEIFAGTLTISPITIASGTARMFSHTGQILTTEHASAPQVTADNGSTLILWAGGRVILKPGFRALNGSFFWAAVDHNMNGYSDMEELTDTDGDGMYDAWEVDHGLNMLANDAGGDLDGDGTSNYAEFLTGRNPNNRADASPLPVGFQLVLALPSGSYLGVKPTTLEVSPAPAP
jgi:hypothetical protein